ncbi:RNA polymerase sigma factor [Dysgonomonas sp. ZJ279]|uniref:RNA polymerase sigma factor n=1 Tax=Dysgonomonas sp. ZJ279 TaxID=2709796 RepID=UPI0013EB1FD6|nr:sigma-70 family RNA polymerase sigma factor [Dysgonomonas sp. ZJ279]
MLTKNTFENDSSLWDSFLKGDDDAYSYIYKKYSKKLFIQGLQFTADRELIKDCIHDVFVRIYHNRNNLSSTNNIKLYLFVALKNSLLNAFKLQKKYTDSIDDLETEDFLIETEDTIEEQLINKETENHLKYKVTHLLSTLTSRQKEAVHYRFIESMSIDEICILMDMNYQSVQNLLQRSLKKIKDSLIIVEKSEYK